MPFKFTLMGRDAQSQARAALLTTPHGRIETPIFMPVGTRGTVKGILQRDLYEEVNADMILANTYHLYLRPGMALLQECGGLHSFMNWQRPILTDSGGYQVYSLAHQRKINEQGVQFKSLRDGSTHFFTPEGAMIGQRKIGADVIMAFDECTPFPCTYEYAKSSMERTHRWLDRCLRQCKETPPPHGYPQALFPIVQGSVYKELRQQSADYIAATEQVGYAIGGVCHPTGQLLDVIRWVCGILPREKPRYLMGVGTPRNILDAIEEGIDLFDCVLPTRNGRNGTLFTTQGIIHIKNSGWKRDFTPIDRTLGNHTSTFYTKAYLHHLMKTGERLGAQIASLHNLCFYLWLTRQARTHILAGDFLPWKASIAPRIMTKITP